MTTPSARFAIGFDADTSGINQSRSALDSLKSSIEKDTKALTEMKAAMERLRGTAEVARFEALPRDIRAAENEVKKLSDKMAKLKEDFAKAPAGKKESIFAEGLKTQGALDSATRKLAGFKSEQEKLGKTDAVKLFQDMKLGSEKLKETLGKNQTAFSRLGGTMDGVKSKLETFAEGAKATGSPLGEMASRISELGKMGKAGILIALAIAAAAIATGFALAIVKATSFAIAMADAARSARLLREASAWGKVTGDDLKSATLAVLDKTNAQEEAVAGLVAEYSRLRFSLAAIENATSAVTIATQTMGAQVGSTIKGLIDRGVDTKRFWLNALDLKGTGLALRDVSTQLAKQMKIAVSAAESALRDGRVKLEDGVRALDAAVEARFGEVAKKQMLALPVQMERFKKNLSTLFSGVNIEPFLEKLDGVLSMFKETSVVGKALKQVFSVALQPFVDMAGDSMPFVEGLVYGIVIAMQKLTITGLRVAIMLKKMWGDDLFGKMDRMKVGLYAGIAAFTLFAGVMTGLAAVLVAVAIPFAIIGATLGVIVAAVVGVGLAIWYAIDSITTAIDDLVEYMIDTDTSMSDAIEGILDAIIDGVTDGITDVAKAFKDLAMAGVKAFKDAIQMKSPPRVFVRIGEAIPDAVAGGVDKGQPAVARSLSEMVDPGDMVPQGAPVGNASQSAKQGESAASYVLNYHGNGSRSDAQQFAQWFHNELERALLAKGLPA